MASQRRRLYQALSAVALPGAAVGILAALPPVSAQAQTIAADLKVVNPHPGASLGANAFSLDVSFKSRSNSPIVTAELWVDGVRWVRKDLDTPQIKNTLSFAVDSTSLSAGQHTFLVRALTANGGVGETTLSVVAGNNGGTVVGGDGTTLAFAAPLNGKRVQGQVELNIDAPAQNGMNPYVTIYVDKQFKTLKNFPPYNYSWDTTTVANGFHTIEATGYLESSQQSTTRTIRVFVDNPGGNTELKHDIPDLSVHNAHIATAKTVGLGVSTAKSVAPKLVPTGEPIATSLLASTHTALAVTPAGLMSALKSPSMAQDTDLALHAPLAATPANHHAIAPIVSAPAVHHHIPTVAGMTVTETSHVEAAQEVASAGMLTALTPTASIKPVAPKMAGLSAPGFLPRTAVAAAPVMPHESFALRTVMQPAHAAKIATITASTTALTSPAAQPMATIAAHGAHHLATHAAPQLAVRPHQRGGVLQSSPLQVAFNGQQIAFDVQPRVEAGLPIAPFRQIFEHTGGQVEWVEKTQVVHAVNADKEIVIKVGKPAATVNGRNVTLARPAFVERGRTIVPLSFVGAALDVDVKYDAATGRLQITSK